MSVYLAGPINGCTDAEAKNWRLLATHLLEGDVLDPMARDYRGVEAGNAQAIVEGDKTDIENASAVLVFAPRPSWGTAMEVLYAFERGTRVVTVVPADVPVSPWLSHHSNVVVDNLYDACKAVLA